MRSIARAFGVSPPTIRTRLAASQPRGDRPA
ncbi:hypothetical protein ACFVVP_25720 [Streptomyces sp. NPDC058128]